MPTYTVGLYNTNPASVFSTGVGSTFTWTGSSDTAGTATITDDEPNNQGWTLDDDNNGSESATANVTIGGNTSTGSNVDAELVWTIRDTVTGQVFDVVQLDVENGAAAGDYTLSEIPLISGRSYEVVAYDTNPNVATGDPAFNFTNYVAADDIVNGTTGDDTITTAYTDHDDDAVGNGADIVAGGDGNDSIVTGGGNDTITGGGGSDTIDGGNGADTIYGGDNGTLPDSAEILNWEAVGNDGADLTAGFSQITGEMEVSVSFANDGNNNPTFNVESGLNVYVAPGETFNTTSNLDLFANGDGASSTTTIDFAAKAGSAYSDSVENVSFRINDVDWGAGNHRDILTINAFDANGDPVAVTLTPGGGQTVSGNTVTSDDTGTSEANLNGSVLVEIAGPLSQIEIIYANGLGGTQGIYVTDIHFDAVAPEDGDDSLLGGAGNDDIFGEAGDDTIDGGTGNDTLTGGAGNDSLTGGTGADQLFGGAGDDMLFVAQGDQAFGGDGDDLFVIEDLGEAGAGTINIVGGEGSETAGDTLRLTSDVSQADITFTNTDDATGGLSGNFTMADGTVVTFSEIENIICFTPGARILTAHGERAIESLRVGDMVITRDHGPQPIRWIGSRTVAGVDRLAPISIAAHVLDGAARPLLVSPQHRLLFTGYKAELLFGCDEVLVAAKHLLDGRDVIAREQAEVTYIHMMLDQHEVIYADGAATESFHAGDIGISAISDQSREEMFSIFPELRANPNAYGRTARPCLKRHEARLLRPAPVSLAT
ncbi:Ca2+-binding protein, RTX toxin-related [Roseovarius lutimaris]|uniref:Ca2+-binding protein, RTX toxin-related n=1 Tax=Roseovarius lutimaris TaxID=1005928 RepID=A0A1I5GMA6_9RHOB|nr:Hint domain-containing protein [Roseovarius lutimaris]SFO37073.1 Ca2+-binding protein, RTX toxin-related [Roseovarius lutimaris]